MNNLNRKTPQHENQVPDILRNVNIKEDVNEKSYQKQKIDDVIEKKQLNTETPNVEDDLSDIQLKEKQRRKSRKIKKALGYTGWVFCFPLMLVSLAIRDKPSRHDDDEWRDDPCLPWWYDVDFKYPHEHNDDDSH